VRHPFSPFCGLLENFGWFERRAFQSRAQRIGAENSTCARFGKQYFFNAVAQMPFFVGFPGAAGLMPVRDMRSRRAARGGVSVPRSCDFPCEVRAKRVFRLSRSALFSAAE
jgi:hypothetical protein